MPSAGVEVERYTRCVGTPWAWSTTGPPRKLLVIDGRLDFAGGVGIAPEWTGRTQDPEHWRDTHFEIEGPVVGQMQSIFLDNWIKVSGKVPHGEAYFPPLPAVGRGRAQMFSAHRWQREHGVDVPAGDHRSQPLDRSVWSLLRARCADHESAGCCDWARREGAHHRAGRAHRLGHIALRLARTLGASVAGRCAHRRVQAHDVPLQGVDRKHAAGVGGSTNFGNRLFHLNDEATLNILDPPFAAEQTRVFEDDLQLSRPVTLQQWTERPWRGKAAD